MPALPSVGFSDIVITSKLATRGHAQAFLAQSSLIHELALSMVDDAGKVLPRLVDLALDITDGTSAGLSIFEADPAPGVFRWRHVQGVLSHFLGATTPRDFSPCGVTVDQRAPILFAYPERYYDWIADAGIVVPEVLLVPLYLGREDPLGTLWVVSDRTEHFHQSHASALTELAAFVSVALKLAHFEAKTRRLDPEKSTFLSPVDCSPESKPASVALLRKLAKHSDLDETDQIVLASAFVERRFASCGTTISTSLPNRIAIVESGIAAVCRDFRDGNRQVIRLLVPGDTVPATIAWPDAFASAFTDCEIIEMDTVRLMAVERQYPNVAAAMERDRQLGEALFLRWVSVVAGRRAEARIAYLICELFMRLTGVTLEDGERSFVWPLTQQMIAETVGLSLVHTNKSLRRLANRGVAEIKTSMVHLLDLDGLKKLAEFESDLLVVDR